MAAKKELKVGVIEVVKDKAVDVKGVQVNFDDNQIPSFIFKGEWNIRDVLHTKRLITREYRKYIRSKRMDVTIKEE